MFLYILGRFELAPGAGRAGCQDQRRRQRGKISSLLSYPVRLGRAPGRNYTLSYYDKKGCDGRRKKFRPVGLFLSANHVQKVLEIWS